MSDTPLKVVFAPGCFDSFEGSQQELDELVAEISETFANMSDEELVAHYRKIDLEDLAIDLDANPEILDAMWAQTGRTRQLQ